MAITQRSMHCRTCGQKTLHTKHTFSDGMGCLITVLTAGLFLPVWIVLWLRGQFRGLHCQQCGAKRANL